MTLQARFIHEGRSIDYTPTSEVAAGSVVTIGPIIAIAPVTIPAGKLGALATAGVFDITKSTAVFDAGDPVYWSGTAAADTGTFLGYALTAAASTDAAVRVLLSPPGAPVPEEPVPNEPAPEEP